MAAVPVWPIVPVAKSCGLLDAAPRSTSRTTRRDGNSPRAVFGDGQRYRISNTCPGQVPHETVGGEVGRVRFIRERALCAERAGRVVVKSNHFF